MVMEIELGETPPQDLEAWLERLDIPLEETSTIDRLQRWLAENAKLPRGMDIPSERQISAVWTGLDIKYRFLPELGIEYRRVEMTWGWQGQYISLDPAFTGIPAGRIMSPAKVYELTGW